MKFSNKKGKECQICIEKDVSTYDLTNSNKTNKNIIGREQSNYFASFCQLPGILSRAAPHLYAPTLLPQEIGSMASIAR